MKGKLKIIIPVAIVLCIAIVGGVIAAFNMNKDTSTNPQTVDNGNTSVSKAAITAEPEPTKDPHEGKVQSYITGEWVDEKVNKKRPFAIMINNIGYANANQKGTSQADVIYEALAEGGITRMLAVYQDPSKVKKIGSVRSARHYYVSFASEYNAIFCHFGQTSYAISKMEELGIQNLSGLSAIGSTVYARDNGYKPPHNVYATGKNMIKGAKKMKYSLKQDMKKVAKHWRFFEEDTDLADQSEEKKVKEATKVVLPFSTYSTAYFTYDKKKQVYKKFEYKKKHMDTQSKTQLQFKNVIIQLVEESNIDRNGYQHMKLHNKRGTGYYCTNGKMIPIEWTKKEELGRMVYWYKNGKRLQINAGKTYIAAFPISEKKGISFTEKKK